MAMPKPTDTDKALFLSLVPEDPRVTTRPMFGNLAAFVNGNMFLALAGADVAVRLGEADRATLLAIEGAAPFDPAGGRPMKEYVVLPAAWREQPGEIEPWVTISLDFAAALPAKQPKQPKRT